MKQNYKIIVNFFYPNDLMYRRYQRYYYLSLSKYLHKSNGKIQLFPKKTKKFKSKNKSNNKLTELKISKFFQRHDAFVGQYVIKIPSQEKEVKIAIDAHDAHEIRSKSILDWSDIYFKSNKWESVIYPEKVLPIINGNGFISLLKIKILKFLRKRKKKKFDIVFISRVYGIENTIRLFEEISIINCKKYLLAIFTKFEKSQPETKDYQLRLDKAGVPWTFITMYQGKLWNYMASSRILVLRAGKHRCIPWRMLDQLCMGACFVYDNNPYPKWPQPLLPNINYVNLGIKRGIDNLAPIEEYREIPGIIEDLLKNNELQQQIRQNNAKYFDEYASPIKVGEYIIEEIKKRFLE